MYVLYPELDFILGILSVLIYALFSVKTYLNISIFDVLVFTRLLPLLFIFSVGNYSVIDLSITVLTIVVMLQFKTVESTMLMVFAFVGSYFMIHSTDLLSFYISLEAQNFCLVILASYGVSQSSFPLRGGVNKVVHGTQSTVFSIENILKYFMLSAFSSGVILYIFSYYYISTGLSMHLTLPIICALMFKLGAAPLHLWVVQIYSSVSKSIILFISTVPKLSLFGFLLNNSTYIYSFNTTDHNVGLIGLFIVFSLFTGAISAYSVPTLRSLFAYSTINEIGLLLLCYDSSHLVCSRPLCGSDGSMSGIYIYLGIYIVSQILLWNCTTHSFFTTLAISLAGLPPFAGFFGKYLIFLESGISGSYVLLISGLFCTVISLVYYLRIVRLSYTHKLLYSLRYPVASRGATLRGRTNVALSHTITDVMLPSICIILLISIPGFIM